MRLRDILPGNGVFALTATDKRSALRYLSERAADLLGIDRAAVFAALTKRDELGSTGIGSGIAMPHARLRAVQRAFGVFAIVTPPIEFGAPDEQPVDMIFVLLLPDHLPEEQLKPLACVARRLRTPEVLRDLRRARGTAATYAILVDEAGTGADSGLATDRRRR